MNTHVPDRSIGPGRFMGAVGASRPYKENGAGMDEIVDLVDENDRVIGRALRSECHGDPDLIHRVVHIMVFNNGGNLLLQRRGLNKRIQPGKWDTSVGGHLSQGEAYRVAAAREMEEEGRFAEVYCKCSIEECERRDPKGLYVKARAGEIPDFTGISAPYEEPEKPELVVETDKLTIKECAARVLEYIEKRQVIVKPVVGRPRIIE